MTKLTEKNFAFIRDVLADKRAVPFELAQDLLDHITTVEKERDETVAALKQAFADLESDAFDAVRRSRAQNTIRAFLKGLKP